MVTRRKIITSLIYKFAERIAGQGVAFVVGIIIARLLSPEHYGMIAILMIFIGIAQIFVQAGFGTALIQKQDIDDTDYSSVFYVTLMASVVFYAIMFFTAPLIAQFYNMPELTVLMRCLALVLLPNSYNAIQHAKITKEMQFKKLMIRSVTATIVSGVIGVAMAYGGFGVWALVAQQLAYSVTSCVAMAFAVKWRPRLLFSFERIKGLFSFGYKMLLSSILNTIYKDLKGLIIGKKYTSVDLGYYDRGAQYPKMLVEAINGTIMSVMFPAFSLEQGNRQRVKHMVRRSIIISSFFVFPAMAGLAAVAKPLVTLMLTEKWLPCVPYLMISCGIYAFHPIHTANLQAIAAMGESGIFFKLEVIKKAYGLVILAITVLCFKTPIAIMLGGLIAVPISCTVNAFPNKRLLDYSIKEQLKDILPALVISCAMGVAVFSMSFIGLGNVHTLVLQVLSGVLLYAALSKIFKVEAWGYMVNVIRPAINRVMQK